MADDSIVVAVAAIALIMAKKKETPFWVRNWLQARVKLINY